MAKEKEETKPMTALERVRSLYAKNKNVMSILDNSKVEKRIWTAADGIPIPEGSAVFKLLALVCFPFNKIIQFAGKPDTGKSTMGLLFMVFAQKAGFKIVLWDTEEKFDVVRFERFGGKAEDIEFLRTNDIVVGSQLVKDLITAIKTDEPLRKILLVVDSIGGGVSRANAEINRIKKRNAQPAQEAKEWAQATRDIVSLMNKYRDSICFYMANQTYAKIGFMQKGDKAKGGDGIEFHSSIIVFWKRLKVLKEVVDGQVMKTGIITQATVTKNHLNQTPTSVYQMNFEVNYDSVKFSNFTFKKTEAGETEAEDEEEGEDAE